MSKQHNFVAHIGHSSDYNNLGGKAKSLNKLVHAGFPVPKAYCVTVSAYQAFLKESGLEDWINSFDRYDTATCKKIRNKIQQTNLPEPIHKSIIEAYNKIGKGRVAVRSSAMNEDSITQSYAGQFETYLDIHGEQSVTESIKLCWGSIWADRVDSYQNNKPLNSYKDSAIGVIIQEMVDADAAGVLFTQDPVNGNKNHIIVESCWGLGEGVVSGQVTTDSYIIDKTNFTVIDKVVRPKQTMSGRATPGIISLLDVPTNKVHAASLTDEQAIKLAQQSEAIRKHYDNELDIEWAVKDNKIWILQARPITTEKKITKLCADSEETNDFIRDNAMFSRMDTGEIVTGLMTPLGLSFCHFYQHNIHGPAIKKMGLLDIGKSQHYMGYIQGHVYLNISASAKLLTQCPPTHDPMKFTKRYATDTIDFSNYINPYGEPTAGVQYFKSSIYWLYCQIRNLFSSERIVKKMIALRKKETARFHKLDLNSMSLTALNKELERIDKHFLEACAAYMPFFLQSFALYDLLTELCDKFLGHQGNGLQNRIKASMNGLRTIEVTKAVNVLAETVRRSPKLTNLFINTSLDQLVATLKNDSEGRIFWYQDFSDFLYNFGSRGRQEFELTIPRWNDDPIYILQMIRMYLGSDLKLDSRLTKVSELREADTEQLISCLPLKAKLKIKFVIAAYSKMAERREATRPTYISETWFYRKIVYEVASRLVKQGIIDQNDIPYIDFNTFRDYVAGRKPAELAFSKTKVNENRHRHLVNLNLEDPPMAIIGQHISKRKVNVTQDNDSSVIYGLGSSPGSITAYARVITDLTTQVESFKQGEILVTKFTDASWTPLFALASGVISDIGSTLSHSSIVSREFGIPAVVNSISATQKIQTGDLIFIDGDAGVIRIEKKANT